MPGEEMVNSKQLRLDSSGKGTLPGYTPGTSAALNVCGTGIGYVSKVRRHEMHLAKSSKGKL